MTYTELVNAIQEYTENYEAVFVANIPVFVEQAETRIYNAVQIPALRKNVTGSTSQDNKYLSCPDDFLAPYSLAVFPYGGGDYTFLLNKDVNFIRESFPNPASPGVPKYYALFGPVYNLPTELTFVSRSANTRARLYPDATPGAALPSPAK